MKKLVNLSLVPVLAFAITIIFSSCTNVVSETPSWDIAGWPYESLLAEYGLAGLSQPPGASSITHNNSNNMLTITFTGTAAAENAINSFFSTWEKQTSSQPGTNEYSRGIAYAVFLTQLNPLFQIQIYKSTTGVPDWPSQSILDKYGLYEITKPEGVYNISYYEEDEALSLGFYGTKATEDAIIDYFKNNNWLAVGPSGYWRGVTYAEFTTNGKPFYSLYATKSISGIPGWPGGELLETFGLHGLVEPTGAADLNYYSDYKSLLVIGFNRQAGPDAILNYFNDPLNHWVLDAAASSTGTYFYSRGVSWVTFTTQDSPYYLLSVYISFTGKSGWPSVEILENYGLHGLSLPLPGAVQAFYNEEADTLTIGFYGNDSTVNAVRSYFSAANNWTGVSGYHRGFASVEFDTTVSPYYEIRLSLDIDGMPGISTDKFEEYGLHELTLPGATRIAWTEENNKSFIIKFYGTQATVNAVTSYFSAANNWTVGESGYQRGFASAEFITAESPFYEIRVSWNVDGTPGISTGKLEEYGLHELTLPGAASAAWTETAGESLIIKFYGDTDTVDEVRSYFSADYNWIPVGVSVYQRGFATVEFDTSASPYYEIRVSWNVNGTPGMPTGKLKEYGLQGFALPGAAHTAWTETAGESLIIRFYGTLATANAVYDFFDDGKGSIWEYRESGDNADTFSWGYALATFDMSKEPYYEISVILEITGNEIATAPPAIYGLTGLTTSLTGATNIRYTENTDILTITFNGTGVTEAAVKDFFDKDKGSIWESSGSGYAWGYAWAEFDTSKEPYYVITVTVEINDNEDLDAALLAKYGLTGLTLTGATNLKCTENSAATALAITFNGTSGTKDKIKDFFDKDKGSIWEYQGLNNNVYECSWGYAYAAFDTSKAPYYEIEVSLSFTGKPGLPTDAAVLADYGLTGLSAALASATNIRHDDNTAGRLIITFNGTSATATAVKDFFGKSGSIWEYQGLNDNVYEYSWGYANATVDTSQQLYYVIEVSLSFTGKAGLPTDAAVLADYGLTGLSAALASATNIRRDDATAGRLIITFNGTSGTATAVKDFFGKSGSIWEYQGLNDNVYEYSWGYAYATFDMSQQLYYVIEVSLSYPGNTNLDSAPLTEYGLTGLSESLLASAGGTNIRYTEKATTLTITFNGTGATVTAVINDFFGKSGSVWSAEWIKDGVYAYSWGSVYAEFDASKPLYYEIWVYLE